MSENPLAHWSQARCQGAEPADAEAGQDLLRKLYLEITTECNMDCPMCVRRQWPTAGARMTEETFDRLLEQAQNIPTLQTVHFGGVGEPLVHPEFRSWVAKVAHAGFQVEFITNGLLLDEAMAEICVHTPVQRLFVSLDSARPMNQAITHAEVFEAVWRNLRRLYAMKVASRSARPEVYALFVASRANLQELWELKRLAPYLGLQGIMVSNLVPYSPELEEEILYRHWSTVPAGLPPSSWNPLVDLPRMDPSPEILELIGRLRAHGTPLRIAGSERYDGAMRCPFVLEGRAAIGPSGDLSPCLALLHSYKYWFRGQERQIHRHTFGNIHQQRLEEIWGSPAYQRFRERVRRFAFPPCIDCGGCDLRSSNQLDCLGNQTPTCGACLWAAGLVQCP
ncbi:MAG: radical SAM protein [Thermoguttaceae bacterium]|nr:radical SAM protein [Thermoguttaceae bacterium]MDW8036593.1 radical SAM protein [Thermoguttaceae bacterium]